MVSLLQPFFFILQVALTLLNDVDLRIYMHTAYGKGFMKDCRISPDAYLQMALQLADYRVRQHHLRQ
jgi:carnitine O-palmitoyltransferase 1